ncbi:polysaccharide lyase beta-sandwich domain-containing protein [Algoriphagus halophytocola]|uniref:Polysaccharide lyase beta-sandwich domain-containing protein n=1 Tax=Algoriphagus halophytocola TaxID=2991499 RepID=A0ABY6MIJ4_9BACT|nr:MULTISPECIES: polysaccharide lyase family 8 super-sandwich domain-containing protein [unclassified Algoriphagus]UZD23622.1 polysaccharide lyase beta-sandwich domain-containing protein [Algoriphagus sp. TR-M5]WBL44915.1 polysaccharide lyase beta-sandwich domain-containing protein [Algoriphagus sp. TR-M9]
MYRLSSFLLLISLLFSSNFLFAYQVSDFELIRNRVFQEYQNSPNSAQLDKEANTVQKEIQPDGSWPDINYADKSMTGWKPDLHIKRIGIMAKAYSRKGTKFYLSASTHQRIINAMNYWTNLTPEPSSKNWWWLSISVPKEIGQLLIAMRTVEPGVPADLEEKLISWMSKTASITKSPGKDGSNLTDIAQHMIMQAALTENADLLKQAVSATSANIRISSKDGIQSDMSFHAHGPELYMHGYGREFLSGIRNIAVYIKGTSFSFTPEQIALISDFTRNGYLQSMRGKYVDYSVIGRGIARNNATRTNSGLIKQIMEIDLEEHQDEYRKAIARVDGKEPISHGITPRNIHYWRSDYTVHHRPEFMVSVNIASNRTIRTESGNGENLNGQFLTEGGMNIAVDGNEYFNIFPNWEWNKIPGTTTPENKKLRKRTNWVADSGNADFVGGVSNGLNGIAVYAMEAYRTTANKSWFFFEDKIICIGAGIEADREENIVTTVNQSLLKGEVEIAEKESFEIFPQGAESNLKKVSYVLHDQIGYYFPENSNLMLSTKNQASSWSEINANSSKKTINQDVFKLWINHKVNPKNDSYAYVILPGVENREALLSKNPSTIKILSNTSKVQAVEDEKNGLVGFVFYDKGAFESGDLRISSSAPAVVLIQKQDTHLKISLAEPTQKLTGKVSLSINSKGNNQTIDFDLPTGNKAGSTVSKTIDL